MTVTESMIEVQRSKVFGTQPKVDLVSPCRIGYGILRLSEEEQNALLKRFHHANLTPHFFIPASGSGSRMFQFLFDFLEKPSEDNQSQVERFLNHLEDFAFFRKIHADIKQQLNDNKIDLAQFVRYVVGKEGLELGDLPKGLVPFHNYGYFILNPFQEQVLQAAKMGGGKAKLHFTINLKFEGKIKETIEQVCAISGYQIEATFSTQNEDTDSIAFALDGTIFELSPGKPLTRPSGHGALLENLNEVASEMVFIKNIDNVQHESHAHISIRENQKIGGLLLKLKEDLAEIVKDGVVNRALFFDVVRYYQLEATDLEEMTDMDIKAYINRPRRVCGMVRNEGQPGGGPFWVKSTNGKISKQIVEKAQIASSGDQFNVMVKSSHFNPVLMACDRYDLEGNLLDLNRFKDDEMYFVVKRNYKGHDILFAEQPGLWNGGMADWLTVFVETDSNAFTPVKTVLDLLESAHQSS